MNDPTESASQETPHTLNDRPSTNDHGWTGDLYPPHGIPVSEEPTTSQRRGLVDDVFSPDWPM